MSDEIESGIYAIVNMETGQQYIGSSVNLRSRLDQHRALLKRGRHHNFRLQDDWDMFGEIAFQFTILEFVANFSDLVTVEQKYLDECQPEYNIARVALNIASGTDFRSEEEQAERISQRRLRMQWLAENFKFSERLRREGNLGSILTTFVTLPFSAINQIRFNIPFAVGAYRAGVLSIEDFLAFLDAGYRSMYDGETAEDIRIRKGLPPKADILDWMGGVESAANGMRAALTLHHMKQRNVSTLQEANRTHSQVGIDVRTFLISQNIYPERLETPKKSYQQLLREQAVRERLAAEDRSGLWALLPAEDAKLDD